MKIEELIVKGKENCSGCYACVNACMIKSISMKKDEEGFWYPEINADICIKCGKCDKCCPILNVETPLAESVPAAYAAINKEELIRMNSSSGGVFHLLACYVLNKNGIVFGAAFDNDWNVCHSTAEDKLELERLCGAKYVQSKIGLAYQQVKKELEKKRWVLFVGTPCQAEGLKAYLKKEYEKLLLVDLICHGVPSPLVWKRYVNRWQEGNKMIQSISFRSKNISWERFSLKILYSNGNEYKICLDKDLYMQGFLQDLYLRPSCHACRFKKEHRVSDFTIADFWGVDKVITGMNDHKGTSLVLLHTNKAKEIFEQVDVKKCEVNFADAIKYNPAMVRSAYINPKREAFFHELDQEISGIDTLINKYTQIGFMKRFYRKTRAFLSQLKALIMKELDI